MNKVAIAGIISFLHGCLDIKNLILGKNHTLLYYLGIAMYPRMFFTVIIIYLHLVKWKFRKSSCLS